MTTKQAVFVNEYVKDFNGTQAAIRAGYSSKTANRIATENLSKPVIRDEVDKRLRAAMEESNITLDWWLKKVKDIAENGKSDNTKVRALDLIGKHLGAYINELSIIQKLPDSEVDDTVNRLIEKMG
jgi:phage terminase small subunit